MKLTILFQPGLPVNGLADGFLNQLAQPGIELHVIDADTLCAQGVQGDAFCNAHGEVYPIQIEPALLTFFQTGGGFLHLGGAPFETAMTRQGSGWVVVTRTFGDTRDQQGPGALERPMDIFRAQLGIMTYAPAYPVHAEQGLEQHFDQALIGCPPLATQLPTCGVTIATTLPMAVAEPDLYQEDHRAYQAKPIIRESHAVGTLVAPDGTPLLTSLVLTKCWGNPFTADQRVTVRPWAIYTGPIEGDVPEALLSGMLRWLSTPCIVQNIDLESATVHAGETVTPSVALHGTLPTNWRIAGYQAMVTHDDFLAKTPYTWRESPVTHETSTYTMDVTDEPHALLLPMRFTLVDDTGQVRDYAESAVVPWHPEQLHDALHVTANGNYFDVSQHGTTQRSRWVSGTNWQDSHQFALTWHTPNPLRIADDARAMADAGMVFIRPHYFMPGWFRSVPGEVYKHCCPELYEPFELGPEISERHLRAIEAHIMLFGRLGLVLMPTLYTNPSPNMGNPMNWMNTSRMVAVPGIRENQQRFARQLLARFGAIPCITWDLCNEVDTAFSKVADWVRDLGPSWQSTGQMVGVGTFNMTQNMVLGETVDWHSIHNPCCATPDTFHSGKPCLFQEAWVPTPATEDGEIDQEYYLNRAIGWTLRFGGAGFMPWNWNMMMTNRRMGGSFVEYWDNELGCGVHADATPRRGRAVMRNWALLLSRLSFDQSACDQVLFVYPKCGMEGGGMAEYVNYLHQQRIPFRAVNDADLATVDTSRTRLVILPYFGMGYREATWRKVHEFASAGGVVWAHNETMMMDEDGQPAPDRAIPIHGGREMIGDGFIEWCVGWNGGSDPLKPLKRTIAELDLAQYPVDALPLTDGTMIFHERWSTDEKTMKTDWAPLAKLPDRNVVHAMQIVDTQGNLQRGWSMEGKPLEVDGYVFQGTGSLFFLRETAGRYLVTGEEIRLTGSLEPPQATLLAWRKTLGPQRIAVPLTWQRENNAWVLRLTGWQRFHWVRITIGV